MKKTTKLLICLILAVCLIGCGEAKNDPESGDNVTETQDTTENPTQKELLPLTYRPWSEFEQSDPTERSVSIPYGELSENKGAPYSYSEELKPFVDYMRSEFSIETDEKWTVFVHFSTVDKSYGIVEFKYNIGNIATSKHVIFNLNGGKADMVFYTSLDKNTDEAALISRVETFLSKYEQEKREFDDGTAFFDEHINFNYNYDYDELTYSYALFFTDQNGLIDNEWGTSCLITESGDADFSKSHSEEIVSY